MFKAVSVTCGSMAELLGPVVGFWIKSDKAIDPWGIVVPVGVEVEEGRDALRNLQRGPVFGEDGIVLAGG